MRVDEEALAWAASLGFQPQGTVVTGHCARVYLGSHLALKVAFRGEEQTVGAQATIALQQLGGPRVEAIHPAGYVLMERIFPGTTLLESGLPEEEAIAICIAFLKQLRSLPPAGLPLEEVWTQPSSLLSALRARPASEGFLHGDLHHENILRGPDGWVPIDPKGLRGDFAYDCVAFLRNPLGRVTDPMLVSDRLDRFELELGLDPWRIWAWAVVDHEAPLVATGFGKALMKVGCHRNWHPTELSP